MLTALTMFLGIAGTSFAMSPADPVDVAPLAEALTFARTGGPNGPRTLAVTAHGGTSVSGVDLEVLFGRPVTDAIAALQSEGWERLRDRIVAAPDSATMVVPTTALELPVDLRAHHIATGTNYPEHAGEADVEDGPFLFPKLVAPSGATANVSAGTGLLDYEVEIAFVTLGPVSEGDALATTGLLVCNDYTDRETLLRNVDVWNPASGKGFTTGKSMPGFLPVGTIFVVPRDVRSFVRSLELRLWVNDDLRQHARADEWIWNLDRILAETWARRDVTWTHRGDEVGLLAPDKTIPARTLIMAGTPAGTVFRGIGTHERLRGIVSWLASGWSKPLAEHVIDIHVQTAHAERRYLQPGDRVVARIDHLGTISNVVTP